MVKKIVTGLGLLVVAILTINFIATADPSIIEEFGKIPLLSLAKETDRQTLADQRTQACNLANTPDFGGLEIQGATVKEDIEYFTSNVHYFEELLTEPIPHENKNEQEQYREQYQQYLHALSLAQERQLKCDQLKRAYQDSYGK